MSELQALPIVWNNTGTTSPAVDISGRQIRGFSMPATVASATFTLLACDTIGGTYLAVKSANGGAAITLTMIASAFYLLTADLQAALSGVRFFKLVGASSETQGFTIKAIVEPRLLT